MVASQSSNVPAQNVRLDSLDKRTDAQFPSTTAPERGTVYFGHDEVQRHSTREDAWIIVEGKVYDITNFLNHHPGFQFAGQVSTVLAILRTLGTDCTEEFLSIHTRSAYRQLQTYYIGDVEAHK